jgi:hypothetical protein
VARCGTADDPPGRGTHHRAGPHSGHRDTGAISERQEARLLPPGSFRAKTAVSAGNGWDTLASRAMHCCATCWEKQRKRPHGVTRTGDVGRCT